MIVSNDCFLYAGKHSEIQHAGFCIIGIVFRGSWLYGSRILENVLGGNYILGFIYWKELKQV